MELRSLRSSPFCVLIAGSLLAVVPACGETDRGGFSASPRTTFGGDRPVRVDLPESYDPSRSYPLLIVLHGYGVTPSIQAAYFGVAPLVESEGIVLAAPAGTENAQDDPFWNATDACCGFGSEVDDVGYLRSLIAEIRAEIRVDERRIFLLGHSNGGFMAHRMACEAPEVAAVVSLAGAAWADPDDCAPQGNPSVLQIHGSLDDTVAYAGGVFYGIAYPGAVQSVTQWQSHDGCTGALAEAAPIDLDESLAGTETRVDRFAGCPAGIDVELWTIQGGSHIPDLVDGFAAQVWGWLARHPQPAT